MPKIKPHKGLQKRVKVTATGKIIRKKANKRHLMSSKTGNRRRKLGRTATVAQCNVKNAMRMLGKA